MSTSSSLGISLKKITNNSGKHIPQLWDLGDVLTDKFYIAMCVVYPRMDRQKNKNIWQKKI